MESEMVAHVGQIGLSWSYCINNVNSLLEVHVCGVWIDAQCVYHQRFRAFDGVECGRWHRVAVGYVCDGADSESADHHPSVVYVERHDVERSGSERRVWPEYRCAKPRHPGIVGHAEAVGESFGDVVSHILAAVYGQRAVAVGIRTQVVESAGVVIMAVGDGHGVDAWGSAA